jgi:hypothetical protein
MPEKVQNPLASTALSKEYGLKGRVSLAVDETIVPVAVVADLVSDGSKAWAIAITVGKFVTGYSMAQIVNPVGSGLICFIDEITGQAESSQMITLMALDAGISITATPFYTDRRDTTAADAAQPRPRLELHTKNTDVTPISGTKYAGEFYSNGFAAIRFKGPYVLTPGTGILIQVSSAVNRILHAGFRGRVRSETPEEAAS